MANRSKLPTALKNPFLTGCDIETCGMHGTSQPVRPRGNWDAKIMWIGEAAGLHEEEENCTFVGQAGQETEKTLMSIGLSMDENFLFPNVCLCRPHPPIGATKQNRTPTMAEIKSCRPHLERIIELHKPKLLVLVGGSATKSILPGAPTIGKVVGTFTGSDHNLPTDADTYSIWHPAYVLRNMNEKPEWVRQLIKLRDYIIGRGLIKK